LGEAITPIQLAGTFFVLAGVYVVSRVKLWLLPGLYCGVELQEFSGFRRSRL
jgi:drug/metabolite transporter (DMT)-like permease